VMPTMQSRNERTPSPLVCCRAIGLVIGGAVIRGAWAGAGKLPDGGVSERPKEHASKACDG
jgi:hypothetical protein